MDLHSKHGSCANNGITLSCLHTLENRINGCNRTFAASASARENTKKRFDKSCLVINSIISSGRSSKYTTELGFTKIASFLQGRQVGTETKGTVECAKPQCAPREQ